jgi:peptidyl-prolyl cis-trans isomerase B (cyclophilin B)
MRRKSLHLFIKLHGMKKKIVGLLLAMVTINPLAHKAQTTTYTYTGKPMFNILTKRAGLPIGTIVVELFPNIAPHHTRNFDSLVSQHFYDTTAFHRVIPGFMIQGGDPNSRHGATSTWGYGQPGQPTVNAEFSKAKHLRGILSAARSTNINSATSQFFICVATAANLDGNYSIYGRVLGGMKYCDTIVNAPRNLTNNMPNQKIEMFITYIGSNDTVPLAPVLVSPTNASTNVDTVGYLQLRWNKVSDGIIYSVDMAYDSLFTAMDTTFDIGTNLVNYNAMRLIPDTKYFWRIKTNNGGHFSNYSQVWNFTTLSATPPTFVGIKEQSIKSLSVYPNPSSGKILFNGTVKGHVLKIKDLQGKSIKEITIEQEQTEVDLSAYTKGIYLYSIANKESVYKQGKLVLK